MISAKRWYIAVLLIAVLLTGGAVTWFVLNGNMPKRPPMRAKQVIATQVDQRGGLDL
ncbi:MAG: hypothetical protein P4N59_22105 [Negativicutes bacterium]|nr:hypothetical protein [Negativicutes bacterium]